MSKFVRPVIVALALLGTVSAASAAPKHHSTDAGYEHQTLSKQLAFWAQFGN